MFWFSTKRFAMLRDIRKWHTRSSPRSIDIGVSIKLRSFVPVQPEEVLLKARWDGKIQTVLKWNRGCDILISQNFMTGDFDLPARTQQTGSRDSEDERRVDVRWLYGSEISRCEGYVSELPLA